MAYGTQRVHILIVLERWCWVSGLQTQFLNVAMNMME